MKQIETNRQPYKNMIISTGLVYGNKPKLDSIYLNLEKIHKPEQNQKIFLSPDEAQSIVWCLSGAVWSWMLSILGRKKMREANK